MIISSLITIALFYSLLWIFERHRTKFDFYDAATVAIAPVIASVLVGAGAQLLLPETWVPLTASLTLILVTYALLVTVLALPALRAVFYTTAVVTLHAVSTYLVFSISP